MEWNDERGFGFLEPHEGGKRVFVHVSTFAVRARRPSSQERVMYSLRSDGRGRRQAVDVHVVGRGRPAGHRRSSGSPRVLDVLVLGAMATMLAGGGWWTGHLLIPVPIGIAAVSVVTYRAYLADKAAARRGSWRTPESALHLLARSGGWPGALLAQRRLRHKTRKQRFRLIFWITVVMNTGCVVWSTSVSGQRFLRNLIAAV